MKVSKWRTQLEKERNKKIRFFALDPHSPIPPEDRADFLQLGLDYYPPNSDLRFGLKLHEHEEKNKSRVETTKGNTQEYIRWGEFRFSANEKPYKLQAYKSNSGEERLWVPFRDRTSGKETYGAGRYLDLEPERHRLSNGR